MPTFRIYLYFLFILLATGCANKEYSAILTENKYFPAQPGPQSKSDSNETELFTFKDIFPEPELHSLIETALAQSPFWHIQLSRLQQWTFLNYVRDHHVRKRRSRKKGGL